MSTKKITFFPSYDSVPDEYRHGRSLALGTDVIAVIQEINNNLTKLTTDRDALLAACEAIAKDGDEFKRLIRRSVCACKALIPEPCAYYKIIAAIAQANKE